MTKMNLALKSDKKIWALDFGMQFSFVQTFSHNDFEIHDEGVPKVVNFEIVTRKGLYEKKIG